MGVPSVVKIKKGNVEFTSKVEIAKYSIRELTFRAMQDVGRYIINGKVRPIIRATIMPPKKKGSRSGKKNYMPQRYQYWARKKEHDLVLGIENKKRGAVSAWWADQRELGTNGQPKRSVLFKAVQANIPTIVQIEAQYLSYMRSEAAALSAAQAAPQGDVQE